jgi:hypothetical protein
MIFLLDGGGVVRECSPSYEAAATGNSDYMKKFLFVSSTIPMMEAAYSIFTRLQIYHFRSTTNSDRTTLKHDCILVKWLTCNAKYILCLKYHRG